MTAFIWRVMLIFRGYTEGSLVSVENGSGKMLLVKHRLRKRGQWSMPGGFCKSREAPEDTAVREVQEETGADLSQNLTFRCRYRQSYRNHYDNLFTAEIKAPPDKLRPHGFWSWVEIAKVDWFDIRSAEKCPELTKETRIALGQLRIIPGYEV